MTEPMMIAAAGLGALLGLIALRMPIAYAMILVGGGGIAMLNGWPVLLAQLKDLAYGQFASYSLSVVPLFILMGALASRCGLSRDLFRAANAWLGWMRGGIAMAAVAACAGFGAVCGSSLATASTIGSVALPELRRYNYAPSLATGAVAAGGVLGILIPPSVVLIVYAIIVEANVVAMFTAALIPGVLAVLFFCATIAIVVRRHPESAPAGPPVDAGERAAATWRILPVVAIFLVVIGGIAFGFFNPTPAASVGVALVALVGLWRGELGWTGARQAALETAGMTGMIYMILLGAELMKIFMARGGVPQALAEGLAASGLSPMLVLLGFLVLLILLGCLLDSLSMILVAIPFFWPVLVKLNGGPDVSAADAGFGMTTADLKIWFGILALVVVELGLITPPVGMNVFIISRLAPDVPLGQTFAGVMPFFVAELFRVALLIAFPVLTLWLTRTGGG